MPAPLIVPWRGRMVRIRHDDPKLEPYAPSAAAIGSAMQLASDARGLHSWPWTPPWAIGTP